MRIGPYQLENQLILAPMAGVTDLPFRLLCRQQGAGMAVSEMITSKKHLWNSRKTRLRMQHDGESSPRSVQIAGTKPLQMAEAARFNVEQGAQIIDINMGCPAKKVCNVAAGSALMKDESLVADILSTTVEAVEVPVTLKIRTGWDHDSRNASSIARIAEDCGIQAIAVHGRTRADAFKGDAEYDTIAEVRSRVNIPLIVNGDIDSPEKARAVLDATDADALMIGRAAQGRPWIFREIDHYLRHGSHMPALQAEEENCILLAHLKSLHDFYGEQQGVRVARKHIGWYCKQHPHTESFRKTINQIESAERQLQLVDEFFRSTNRKRIAA